MITLWYCPLFLRHRLQSSKLKNTPLNKSEINVGFNGIRKQVRWRLYSTYTAVKNGSENFSFFVARFANTTRWSSFFPHYCHYLKSLLLCCSERCYRIEILWRSDIFCSSVEVLQKVQAMQHTVGASNATHSGSKQCNAQWEQAMQCTVGASNGHNFFRTFAQLLHNFCTTFAQLLHNFCTVLCLLQSSTYSVPALLQE